MKAWQLLDSSSKWTTEVLARRADGMSTRPQADNATCYCTIGALLLCYPGELYNPVYFKLRANLNTLDIADWNDSSTYEQVVAKLKELDI